MTVKDIFALRKQGKIEEAYEAIRPIYREHKGHYTTICMFACGSDMFRLRVQQGRFYEATKIYAALKRMLPMLDDKDGRAAGFSCTMPAVSSDGCDGNGPQHTAVPPPVVCPAVLPLLVCSAVPPPRPSTRASRRLSNASRLIRG